MYWIRLDMILKNVLQRREAFWSQSYWLSLGLKYCIMLENTDSLAIYVLGRRVPFGMAFLINCYLLWFVVMLY